MDRVIDGDTIDVRIGDKTERVRLLNIDAPETKNPGQPVECLGPEASEFLSRRLPTGTVVELRYDINRTDPYGRTLAAVYESGKLVNAEVARAGLAAPVVFEPNRKYYPEVLQAAQQARSTQRGAHDPTIECTLPSQIGSGATQAITALEALGNEELATIPEVDLAISSLNPHLARLTSLVNILRYTGSEEDPSLAAVHSQSERTTMLAGIEEVRERLLTRLIRLGEASTAIGEAKQKADEERAKRETEHKEAQAAKKKAEAKAAAERRAAAARAAKSKADKRRSSGKGSGGGYPGYTGPRCYAPGGKTWKPC